jgi:hypothetical protein
MGVPRRGAAQGSPVQHHTHRETKSFKSGRHTVTKYSLDTSKPCYNLNPSVFQISFLAAYLDDGASDGNALLLPTGKVDAPLRKLRVVPISYQDTTIKSG